MVTLAQRPKVEIHVTLSLNEEEARALEAIVCYGADSFLKCFYEHLGKHYLQPHEKGLRTLFDGVSETLAPILSRADKARKCFNEK